MSTSEKRGKIRLPAWLDRPRGERRPVSATQEGGEVFLGRKLSPLKSVNNQKTEVGKKKGHLVQRDNCS